MQVQLGPGGIEKIEGLGDLNDYERESLEVTRLPSHCGSYPATASRLVA